MLGSMPSSTGRRYSAPGGSGTVCRLAATASVIIAVSSSAGGTGSISSSALRRIRATWASSRNIRTAPSAPLCAFIPSKQEEP